MQPQLPPIQTYDPNPAFERVRVDYVVQGGARVSWELNRHFIDPVPYIFQLQAGHTALEAADDWVDTGEPVTDGFMAFDDTKRLFGKTLDVHYRVKLTTPRGTYYSMTASVEGKLSKRDWITYREMLRKELLRHVVQTSVPGYLLKAKRYGPRCPVCTDELTQEITVSQCVVCYGTGFSGGYFTPLPATYSDIGMETVRDHRDPNKGMDKQYTVQGRFIGDPQLYSYDVWCNQHSDERYYINTTAVKAQIRGVPVVYDAELRLAPFTDVIYKFPLTESSSSAELTRVPENAPKWQKPKLNYLESAFAELKERRTRSSRR